MSPIGDKVGTRWGQAFLTILRVNSVVSELYILTASEKVGVG
jgi:hypothetical protein